MSDQSRKWSRFGLGAHAACLLTALVIASCGSDQPQVDGAIDRAVFIQTYVDLRMTALDTDSQRLADPARDSVLTHNGVSADDLTHFADAYGAEPEFMREVWAEIETLLDRPPGDGS